MQTTAQPTLFASLTNADRCDSCGAAALAQVMTPAGLLLFCGHHFRKNAPALSDFEFQTELDELLFAASK